MCRDNLSSGRGSSTDSRLELAIQRSGTAGREDRCSVAKAPRRNHCIGKSEDPSDPSDDHAYSPQMILYSPKSNALVHWRQTLSTHCHRGQPYMHALCAVVINHYECPKQIAFFEKYKCRKLLAFSIIN